MYLLFPDVGACDARGWSSLQLCYTPRFVGLQWHCKLLLPTETLCTALTIALQTAILYEGLHSSLRTVLVYLPVPCGVSSRTAGPCHSCTGCPLCPGCTARCRHVCRDGMLGALALLPAIVWHIQDPPPWGLLGSPTVERWRSCQLAWAT